MRVHEIAVEVRDKTMKRVGQIAPEVLNFDAKRTLNNVGTWSLTLPREHEMATELAKPGSGIVVTKVTDGYVIFSGPTTAIDYVGDKDDPWGSISFQGQTECVALWDYLAWPQPTNSNPATQARPEDVRTGKAEALMHAFVNANMGPSAPAARKKTWLTMGTNGNRGPTITRSGKFTPLGDLLSEIAGAGKLGFRMLQRGNVVVFETFPWRDNTKKVRFDVLNGSLEKHTVAVTPPSVTQVIVSSTGTGGSTETYSAKTSTQATTAETAWGRRIERVVQEGSTTDTTAQSASDKALNEGGFTQTKVQAIASDDTVMSFGDDWEIGDMVTIVVDDEEKTALITGLALKAGPGGTMLGAILGDPTEFDPEESTQSSIRAVERRVDALERNTTGVGTGQMTDDRSRAAQLIRDRQVANLAIFEDWTWVGAPAIVGAYNDALLNDYIAQGGDVNNQTASEAWLLTQINATGPANTGSTNGWVALTPVNGFVADASFGGMSYKVANGICYFSLYATRSTAWTTGTTITTLPVNARHTRSRLSYSATGYGQTIEIVVLPNGTISALAGTGGIAVSGSFPIG